MAVAQGSRNFTQGDADRLFVRAVAASIAVHALILVVLPGWFDAAKRKAHAPAPLVARLAQPKPAPNPLPEPPARPEKPAEPLRRSQAVESARPILTAPPSPLQVPVTIVAPSPAPEAPRAPEPVQQAAPAAITAPPMKVEPAAVPPPAASASGDAADPATLGQYRIAIISAAKRYKRYPRLAIDNNWEGQAEIRMVVGADGGIASISIRSPSGFEVLDQQALEMIRKAKPLAPIPPALRGKAFTIDVPVVFSLKEETG